MGAWRTRSGAAWPATDAARGIMDISAADAFVCVRSTSDVCDGGNAGADAVSDPIDAGAGAGVLRFAVAASELFTRASAVLAAMGAGGGGGTAGAGAGAGASMGCALATGSGSAAIMAATGGAEAGAEAEAGAGAGDGALAGSGAKAGAGAGNTGGRNARAGCAAICCSGAAGASAYAGAGSAGLSDVPSAIRSNWLASRFAG